MSRVKLTKRTVEGAEPTSRDVVLWDSELPGFGLKVTPSGRRAYFVFYRTSHGVQRKPMIGLHGSMTCDGARDLARQWLAAAARGEDPSAQRQAQRRGATVRDLVARFIAEHAKPRTKPSTAAQYERMMETKVLPKLGGRKIETVTRSDVMSLMHDLRSIPYEANRVRAALSKMFNLAEFWMLRPDGSNPCRHVPKFREVARSRFFAATELEVIGDYLGNSHERHGEPAVYADIVRFLALTGCRLGEVLGLRWEWIEADRQTIYLPDAKAGARVVYVGDAARQLLFSREPASSDWVFPSPAGDGPTTNPSIEGYWRRMRKRTGLSNARLHDLRHTVGTYGGQTGHNAFIIRDLLGHKTLAMTNRYVERANKAARVAATEVAGLIDTALGKRSVPRDNELPVADLTGGADVAGVIGAVVDVSTPDRPTG